MTQIPGGCPVVMFVAANRGMAANLLRRHHDDGTGRCAGCVWHGSSRPAARYPCLIHHYATKAFDLETRRVRHVVQ